MGMELISIKKTRIPWNEAQYNAKRDFLKNFYKQNPDSLKGSTVLEKRLYHGTSKECTERILMNGFDPAYFGINGTAYGEGCYFAVEIKYSLDQKYAKPAPETGEQYVFIANVLVGSTFLASDYHRPPNQILRHPPLLPVSNRMNQGPKTYDSAVNDFSKPTIFVTFQANQAYPEYLLVLRYAFE